MNFLILKQFNLLFLYVLFFPVCICSINEFQGVKQTTLDIDYMIKNVEDQANLLVEKGIFCSNANITNLIAPEGNDIKVIFKLTDQKFENCFKYFKIILRKQRRTIKEEYVTYIHDKLKMVSYRFKNISCGIYEVFVQPCSPDIGCLLFEWTYKKSINITSENCITSLQKSNSTSVTLVPKNHVTEVVKQKVTEESDEKSSSKIIIISSVTVLIILLVSFGFATYCRNSDIARREYVEVAIIEANRTNVKPVCIYILFFQDYDDETIQNKIKKDVEVLKNVLLLLLNYLFDATKQTGQEFYFSINIKLVECKLSRILPHLRLFLYDKLHESSEDDKGVEILEERRYDILKRIILVDPKLAKEDENIVENVIFSDVKEILQSQCIAIRLPTSSRELGIDCVYIPDGLVDLCCILCSSCGLCAFKTQKILQKLLPQHMAEDSELAQLQENLKETVNHNGGVPRQNSRRRNFFNGTLQRFSCIQT